MPTLSKTDLREYLRSIGTFAQEAVKVIKQTRDELQAMKDTDKGEKEEVERILAIIDESGLMTTGPADVNGSPQPENADAAVDAFVKVIDDADAPNPEIVDSAMSSSVDVPDVETTVEPSQIIEEIISDSEGEDA